MTVAATDSWGEVRDDIVSDALANVGAIAPGDQAAGQMRDHAVRRLNAVVKAVDANGEFLWRTSRLSFTTTNGTSSYTLDATVFAVDAPGRYTRAGTTQGTPLQPMTRDEYMTISDRTSSGQATRYYIETNLSGVRKLLTMFLWPVPDQDGDTVEYAGAVRAKDAGTGANTPDFPSNWIAALTYMLSADLAPTYGQPDLAAHYEQRAAAELDKQVEADNENQDFMIVPFGGC